MGQQKLKRWTIKPVFIKLAPELGIGETRTILRRLRQEDRV